MHCRMLPILLGEVEQKYLICFVDFVVLFRHDNKGTSLPWEDFLQQGEKPIIFFAQVQSKMVSKCFRQLACCLIGLDRARLLGFGIFNRYLQFDDLALGFAVFGYKNLRAVQFRHHHLRYSFRNIWDRGLIGDDFCHCGLEGYALKKIRSLLTDIS